MLLGSARPLVYDPAWLGRLVGPHGALGELGREYLGVDQSADYFGHLLLGPTGVAELLKRRGVVHRDDLPRLEFVAARRFLDSQGTEGVFDSLVALRAATQAADGASPFLFAKALTVRRGDAAALRYIDGARRSRGGGGTREGLDSSRGRRTGGVGDRARHVAAPLPPGMAGERAHAHCPGGTAAGRRHPDAPGGGGARRLVEAARAPRRRGAPGGALRGRGAAVRLAARVRDPARRRAAARRAVPAGRGPLGAGLL